MNVRTRMVILILAMGVIAFGFLFRFSNLKLRPVLVMPIEDDLVDFAALLAAQLATASRGGELVLDDFADSFSLAAEQPLQARIYAYSKQDLALSAYVTDARGIVRYDSAGLSVGQDFSEWRDIKLTLAGEYGARSSWVKGPEGRRLLFFVGAPIQVEGRVIGVVSIGKSVNLAHTMVDAMWRETVLGLFVAIVLALLWGLLFTTWITRPIRQLTDHVLALRDGRGGVMPRLGRSDIGLLGQAFEEMRDALEGKKYVEQYVQTLTHEIKSPLSAIRGAAELLQDEMPAERRTRFLANIATETSRIQNLVDRLLELSAVENRKTLRDPRTVDLVELVGEIAQALSPMLEQRQVTLRIGGVAQCPLEGERFLLHLALSNLLRNAVEFSPAAGEIGVVIDTEWITIEDQGPGIPDYALTRVFERFYSLSRPDTGKKSSGLGLSIVRSVAELHGGQVRLENRAEGGARATWTFRFRGSELPAPDA